MTKKKLKEKKLRDFHALNAIQRKAGAIKDAKKEASKNACKKWKERKRNENS